VSYYEKINRIGLQCFSAVRSDGICQMGLAELSPDSVTHPHNNPFNAGELPRDKPGDYYILNGGLYYKDLLNADNLELPYVTGAYVSPDYGSPVFYQGGGVEINDQLLPREMFTGFHAIRPGDILCKGDPFVIDSVAFPNVPVDFEIAITQPDGSVFHKRGSSNRFGFINDPAQWQELGKEGIYSISYIIYKGEKSGSPIGTSVEKGAMFNIYVIDGSNSNRVDFNLPRVTELNTTQPAEIKGDTNGAGIIGGRVYITVSFQGALVEDIVTDISNGEFTYTLDPVRINTMFPNYSISDPNDRLDLTFYIMGLTANGKVKYAADRLYTYGPYLHAVPLKYEEIRAEDRRAREQKLKREEKGKELRSIRGGH